MGTRGGYQVPAWMEPWIGGGLLLIAVVLLAFAFRFATAGKGPPKVKWGNAIGTAGGGLFIGGLGIALLFGLDYFPGLFALSITGFVAAGVGGTLAGWQRSGPH